MLPIQPPLIFDYFSFNHKDNNIHKLKKSKKIDKKMSDKIDKKISKEINKLFFLSWEDALWHLLNIFKISKNLTVLVPSFFCWDVVENMENHGLKHRVYLVDKYLQPNLDDFIKSIKKYKPRIVIIFHTVGIENNLFKKRNEWLKYLPKNAIIIEDCVHRVINSTQLKFINSNHFIIDSLRKVVPVQGSWLYSKNILPRPLIKNNIKTFWYRFKILFWWLVMQLFLVIAYYAKWKKVSLFANKYAEKTMKIGYDMIGDHKLPSPSFSLFAFLSEKIDTEKISNIKIKQALLYKKLLASIIDFKTSSNKNFSADCSKILKTNFNIVSGVISSSNSDIFFEIPFKKSDYSQLRGFPLGINIESAEVFLQYIRKNKLLLRFELNDGPWSLKQKIVYLPMGLHVSEKDIIWTCKIILDSARLLKSSSSKIMNCKLNRKIMASSHL